MLIGEAAARLNERYSVGKSVCGVSKSYRVYATDKELSECDIASPEARVLWLSCQYGDGDDAYVILTGFDTDGVSVEIDEKALQSFDEEMKSTELCAERAENAKEYFSALRKEGLKEAEEQMKELEESIRGSMRVGIFLSVGAFLLLIALLITAALVK